MNELSEDKLQSFRAAIVSHPYANVGSVTLRELDAHISSLTQRLEAAEKAAGFCDKHKPDGGARNCLVCGVEKLSFALSRISYLCGEPNEMQQSNYDTHFNEEEVVKQVEQLHHRLTASEIKCAELREGLELAVDMAEELAPKSHTLTCLKQALGSTPDVSDWVRKEPAQ